MTERHDARTLPANVARTMPYTAYIGVAAYAAIFASEPAGWLVIGLVTNEVSNHALKSAIRWRWPSAIWRRRPPGAADTGIYPAHDPQPSETSGMPSGHAQTASFLATVLLAHIWHPAVRADRGAVSLLASSGVILATAITVIMSRTRLGGPFCVHVRGQMRAPHTLLQVVAGAAVGILNGLCATRFYRGSGASA